MSADDALAHRHHSPISAVQKLLQPLTTFQHSVLLATAGTLCALLLMKIAQRLNGATRHGAAQNQDETMRGKTVIVTGANAGIGFATAMELAARGARVILACRSPCRGQRAAEAIRELTGNKEVVCKTVDMGCMHSVKAFATEILSSEPRLDVLINNAAVTGPNDRRLTEENLEVTFATNYIGPFLLTNLLSDLLQRSAPSRVVNVTSSMYTMGKITLDDLNSANGYPGAEAAYSKSKLALNLFTVELARRLKGSGVTCNALHPGVVATQFNRKEQDLRHFLWNVFLQAFGKSPRDGARTSLQLATAAQLEDVTGKYFVSNGEAPWSSTVLDEDLAGSLWEKSKDIVRNVLGVPM